MIDLRCSHLIEQPTSTVHGVYDCFGLQWSNDFKIAILAWLRDDPRGKQGRNSYTQGQFGLTYEDVRSSYTAHNRLFLESSSTTIDGEKLLSFVF